MPKRDLVKRIDLNNPGLFGGGIGVGARSPQKYWAQLVVAAHDSTTEEKAGADYICTGINDEIIINQALSANGGGSKRVVLLDGTFNVLVGVIVISSSDVTLEGQGDSTILRCKANGAGTILISVTATDATIENIRFNMSGAASTGAVIKGSGGTRLVVQGCHFRSPSRAIWALNCDDSRMSNNLFYDFNNGILFDSCDHVKANDNIGYPNTITGPIVRATNGCNYTSVTGNVSSGSSTGGFSAIDIAGGANTVVSDNIIYDSDTGIYVSGQNATIADNVIIESVHGILLNGDNNVCTGNFLRNTTGNAFYGNGIYSEDYHTIISGNYVTGYMYGVYLSFAIGGIVSDNYLIGNSWVTSPTASQTAGIYLYADNEEILITNNHIRKAYVDFGGTLTYVQAYGIRIEDSSSVDTIVIDNDIRDGGVTGDFFDAGTNTLYRDFDGSTKLLALTIATGAVTIPGNGTFSLLPETGTADDLDTISGGKDGMIVYIRNDNATNTITLKDGTGNLDLRGIDIELNSLGDAIQLIYDATSTNWLTLEKPNVSATLTIATGVVTLTLGAGFYTLLPETGTADDLDTINGGLDGMSIRVRNDNATNTITLKDGTGNLDLRGIDVALNSLSNAVELVYDATSTNWITLEKPTVSATLTVATGVAALTLGGGFYKILPETGTADDIDTISGGLDGMVIYIRNDNVANTVTLKDGTGNLDLLGADVALNAINVVQALIYDTTQALWLKL